MSVLVIGFGNTGRGDDGLGQEFVARLETAPVAGVSVECAHQLGIEHAEIASRHDVVVFVDAALAGEEPFSFTPVEAAPMPLYTTHSVPPGAVVELARSCFSRSPASWLLAIRGYEFVGVDGLSEAARANLDAAEAFLRSFLVQAAGDSR